MPRQSNPSIPSDVCLLLRADAEQSWLHREVIPVLHQVEARERLGEEEEVGAALAYLEAMWDQARLRALATDAARADLAPSDEEADNLSAHAGRYHAAVRALRELVAARVTPFIAGGEEPFYSAGPDVLLAAEPIVGGGGRAPRAA